MKKYKNVLIFILFVVYSFFITYYSLVNTDLVWNYGFSYNFASGLKMYTDFNMVITPLYPTIFGILMKIFGSNMIVFYLANAFIPATIFYIVYKYYRKALYPTIILLSFVIDPNYNLLCLVWLFILFLLEDKKKNDYLIGIVLGLAFLTKSPLILLTLVSLYYFKDIKKIFKRFIGFLIPNIIYIIYFYFKGSLFDYINYAFGSLIDFATKNVRNNFGIIVFILSIIVLIYLFRKYKDIKILYILAFQIISYPIFNFTHTLYSLTPTVFYLFYINKNKFILKYQKYLALAILCPVLATILTLVFKDMVNGRGALDHKLIEDRYDEIATDLYKSLDGFDNTYFVIYETYYIKLLYNYPINRYDLLLNGNMGYKGSEKVIDDFKKSPIGTRFVVYKNYDWGQVSREISKFVKDNYRLSKTLGDFQIYIK